MSLVASFAQIARRSSTHSYMLQNGAPPASWTKDIASFVKSIAPRHLVVDGSDGITNAGMQPIEGLNVDEVGAHALSVFQVDARLNLSTDIVSNHLYPLSNRLSENDVRLANQHGASQHRSGTRAPQTKLAQARYSTGARSIGPVRIAALVFQMMCRAHGAQTRMAAIL